MEYSIRKAMMDDCPALEALIALSARTLGRTEYSAKQIEAALQGTFGVDTELIADGTYFVAVAGETIVGCGGWGKRKTLFGGNKYAHRDSGALDPHKDPAKIRAFFVHPQWARKGIAKAILSTCETEARSHGFHALELMATLPGIPFYSAMGFEGLRRESYPLGDGLTLEGMPMRKRLSL
jgi:GNAT superfamily N-acetyltransferase